MRAQSFAALVVDESAPRLAVQPSLGGDGQPDITRRGRRFKVHVADASRKFRKHAFAGRDLALDERSDRRGEKERIRLGSSQDGVCVCRVIRQRKRIFRVNDRQPGIEHFHTGQ
ncbi:hypothetical protein [Cohnella thermotolerans]|uniref:hypothetical protein n=1 Tax=Cohnella thermotolerans TaxID=329858 RepID=UPI003B8396ED